MLRAAAQELLSRGPRAGILQRERLHSEFGGAGDVGHVERHIAQLAITKIYGHCFIPRV